MSECTVGTRVGATVGRGGGGGALPSRRGVSGSAGRRAGGAGKGGSSEPTGPLLAGVSGVGVSGSKCAASCDSGALHDAVITSSDATLRARARSRRSSSSAAPCGETGARSERWTHMERDGHTWREMDTHGERWTHMERDGHTWRETDTHGERWKHMERDGNTWREMDARSCTGSAAGLVGAREGARGAPRRNKGQRGSAQTCSKAGTGTSAAVTLPTWCPVTGALPSTYRTPHRCASESPSY